MIANMMKPRSQRMMVSEQVAAGGGGSSRGAKLAAGETLSANGVAGAAAQQASAAAARKRRSSINVYDQPSSLNSRLRQLETDMLRLDEDRTKLFDDTHTALAQYELKLSEIHAILKSRQDNVEKYVEDMRTLLAAKEEFEKQTKLLNEKHDRIHEKFMHRETIISREIKLLKNKFEVLEKNRQFRSMLQKSNLAGSGGAGDNITTSDDLTSNLDGSADMRNRSETGTTLSGLAESTGDETGGGGRLAAVLGGGGGLGGGSAAGGKKNVRIKLYNFGALGSLFEPLFGFRAGNRRRGRTGPRMRRRKSNRVASITTGDNLGTVAADTDGLAGVVESGELSNLGSQPPMGHTDGGCATTSSALPGESLAVDLSGSGGTPGPAPAAPTQEVTAKKRKGSFLGRLFTRRGKT